MEHRRLDWLQALRGVAAVGVLLLHAHWVFLYTRWWQDVHPAFQPLGTGVDLFFVISGFIMFYTTQAAANVGDTVSFMKRRFLRIYPAYAVLSLVVATFFILRVIHKDFHAFPTEPVRQLGLSLLFMPVTYSGVLADQTIGSGWTLNYEWYFYVIFGVSIAFGKFRWYAFAAWMAIFLVVFPLFYHSSPDSDVAILTRYPIDYMKLACNPIVFEFLMGIVAGAVFASEFRIQSTALCYTLILITVSAAVVSVGLLPNVRPFIGIAFFSVIVVLAVCSEPINLNCGRALTRLGDVSYTLYLVHWPIAVFTVKLIVMAHVAALAPSAIAFTLVLLCSLGAAFVLSPLLERKLPSALVAVMTTIPHKIRSIQRQPEPILVAAQAAGAPPVASASRDMPPNRP